jgi:hypothetical protein
MAPRDWRNPADYADLASLDLSSLAWEFLRRNPEYQLAYRTGAALGGACARWGLRFAADPALAAAAAGVFWCAELAPAHLVVLALSPDAGILWPALEALSVAARMDGGEHHLRLANGLQLLAPADLAADAALAAAVPLDADLGARLTALTALERVLAARGPAADPLSPLGRRRAVQMVRALDGRGANAPYREIARHVLGRGGEGAGWRTSAARDVAIRLCRSAARLMADGYRRLLGRRR